MMFIVCARMAIIFYCLGMLDVLGVINTQSSDLERETWKDWIWEQYICRRSHFVLSRFDSDS